MAAARARLGAAALLACAAFAGVGAPALGQQEARAPERVQPPTELLEEYPFEQGRLSSAEREARSGPGASSTASPSAREQGGDWRVVWLALGAAALLGALALIARRAQRPRTAPLFGRGLHARTTGTGALVLGTEPKVPSSGPATRTARFPRRPRPAAAANGYVIANQKGGVGKTTISVVLGAAAARRGKRVLLVDLDPQASATSVLAADHEGQPSMADVIVDGTHPLRETVVPTNWGVDLSPAERRLRSADFRAPEAGASVLRRELATAADYDLVLLDCPPSLGRLTLDALTAARHVLIVTEPTYLALHAMEELLDTLNWVSENENPSLALDGVVLNRVESTAEHRRSLTQLEAHFGPRLWTPHIPKRAILQDAVRQGTPPQDLATHSHYATEIALIFDQLVERFPAVELKA
jgi:chromosome partitioning protein